MTPEANIAANEGWLTILTRLNNDIFEFAAEKELEPAHAAAMLVNTGEIDPDAAIYAMALSEGNGAVFDRVKHLIPRRPVTVLTDLIKQQMN